MSAYKGQKVTFRDERKYRIGFETPRAPCNNTIQEQGPSNYTAMRERLEAARKADGAPREQAAAEERFEADIARLVKDLTGEATTLFVPTMHAVPVVADVENDGDRGPRVSDEQRARSAFAAQMQAFASSAPVDDLKVLGAIVSELPGLRLLSTCEAFTAAGLRGHGDDRGMPATTQRETSLGSLLDAWRAFQREVLPASSHLPRRTIGDYLNGRVAVPAKDGAK